MKDCILQEAKIEAAKRHISLTSFIEEAVEQKLNEGEQQATKITEFEIITFDGGGVNPGIDLNNSASLYDLMEG